jgi:hypothetical protein
VSKFKVGDRVMVVATWFESDNAPPPIGSVGEVTAGMDFDGDYDVSIADWPCMELDPDWFIPHWALIRIDDDRPELTTWETVHEVCRWLPGMGVAHGL